MRHIAKLSQPARQTSPEQVAPPAFPPVPERFLLEQLLTPHELAARRRCATKTLANKRWRSEGCPFVKLGRLVRYRLSDVVAAEKAGDGRQ